MTCPHQLPGQTPGTVTCRAGRFGGSPSAAVCRRCLDGTASPRPHADLAERRPCPDAEDLAALDAAAQSAVAALATTSHPDANLYAERLRVARGLAFTDCARRTRLRAIIQDCQSRHPKEPVAPMPD